MAHWATVLDAIEQGIQGDARKCREYAALLLEKLESDGEETITRHLRKVVEGHHPGMVIHLADNENEAQA